MKTKSLNLAQLSKQCSEEGQKLMDLINAHASMEEIKIQQTIYDDLYHQVCKKHKRISAMKGE